MFTPHRHCPQNKTPVEIIPRLREFFLSGKAKFLNPSDYSVGTVSTDRYQSVMLNLFQHLIKRRFCRFYSPLERGSRGVLLFSEKEERGKSKNKSHKRPPMKRSTEINQTYANSIHVMLNLFQHLNQPSPGAIPTQVRDDSRFGSKNVKAQMSKLTLASGRPPEGEFPTQVRNGACFGANVKAQMSKLTFASLRPPEVEIPTQVRDDSRFSTNVKAHSKVN